MIKDFDTFEANLVMSTLSPEDQESECFRSRSLVQFHSQTTDNNISLDKMHAKGKGDATEEGPNNEASSKKRHINSTITDSEFGLNTNESPDVLRKKRKMSIENRRDTNLPSANNSQSKTNHREKSAPPKESRK